MSVSRSLLAIAFCFGLMGCNANQKMCEKSVKATLLNPETTELLDYQEMSPDEYLSQFGGDAAKSLAGDAGVNAARSSTKETFDVFSKISPELKIAKFRVRAEGKLGNLITTKQMCFVTKDSCNCHDEDSFGG